MDDRNGGGQMGPADDRDDRDDLTPERSTRRAEDARLVTAIRNGDPDAFGRLYDDWFDRVHDLAGRIVNDDDAAADIAQAAFVQAWRNLDSLQDVTVRTNSARVLESENFTDEVFEKLHNYCAAIDSAVSRIVTEG